MSRHSKSRKILRRKSLPVIVALYIGAFILLLAVLVTNFLAHKYSNLISVNLNQPTTKTVHGDAEATQFTSSYSSDEERQAALAELGGDLIREGSVLLTNADDALPLAHGAKVTLLGQSSVAPVWGGGGSASISVDDVVGFADALRDSGFELNPIAEQFYTDGPGKNYRRSEPDAFGKGEFAVNEVPASEYTQQFLDSFADYSDAGIVVIGRSGSESQDLPSTPLASGYHYLQLDDDERALLQMAREHFDTVVVVLNTLNPMELAPLDTAADAVLWVGAYGQTGTRGIGDLLDGSISPSGHLVDTYANDVTSAPSFANSGSYSIANAQDPFGRSYMAYAEGIYVGYRYYETRYEDIVMNTENAGAFNYGEEVRYPFGFGLSYTQFEWSDFSVNSSGDGYTLSVDVSNIGNHPGKDVVQFYAQSPYTAYDRENGIEKSSVELVGFSKTDELQPGERQKVSVEISRDALKSYDASGQGGYILEAGDYYLTAAHDAHEAINNVLAAKGYGSDSLDAPGHADMTHREVLDEESDDQAVSRQFQDADLRTWDPGFSYLSRSNWQQMPKTYADGTWQASADFLDAMLDVTQSEPSGSVVTDTVDPDHGQLNVAMMADLSRDDPLWQTLVEQMSVAELDQLVRIGGYSTQAITSIGLPATVDKDGASGISSTLVGGENGMGYAPTVVLASSWNKDLAQRFGEAIGEDSLNLGVTVWYAPSVNIHRSPFGGRTFEYYSEDPLVSGDLAAQVVAGARAKGVIATVKHFALNDQETNRMGLATFANEQTIREIYLKPFEIAVRDGGANAVMASMNRLGPRWTGGHKGLMTHVLREEWGFSGFAVTDQASFPVFAYQDLREGLEAGTDLWLNTDSSLWALSADETIDAVIASMQKAAGHIVYTVSQSNAMNGLSSDSVVVQIVPAWRWILYAVDAVTLIAIAAMVTVATRGVLVRRRDRLNTPDQS